MRKQKHYYVGLILITRLPDGSLRAMLRVRGEFDPYTSRPTAYPDMCMLTLQAECSSRGVSSHKEALRAEFKRRLSFQDCSANYAEKLFSELKLVKLSTFGNSETHVTNYGAFVDFYEFLINLKTTVFERGIRFVGEAEIESVENVRDYNKKTGITDTTVVAMFLEDKRALERAFMTVEIPHLPFED